MVVGVSGEVVVNLVVLGVKQEHAQIPNPQLEVLDVLDRRANLVTQRDVLTGNRPVLMIVTIHVERREVCARQSVVQAATVVDKDMMTVPGQLQIHHQDTTLV